MSSRDLGRLREVKQGLKPVVGAAGSARLKPGPDTNHLETSFYGLSLRMTSRGHRPVNRNSRSLGRQGDLVMTKIRGSGGEEQ
jgi:hypothetical protein